MRTPHTPLTVAGLLLVALSLAGCDRTPADPPVPTVNPVQIESGSTPGSAQNTSVPAAASVIGPATAIKRDPEAGRSNKAMSPAQESSAMPIPGQNNDHSAPLSPAKPASGP